MSDCVWLLRHGDTEWTEKELHTGRAEPSLSAEGREQATRAGELLAGQRFAQVAARAMRVLQRLSPIGGRCLIVGHGKFLRALGAIWLGREIDLGASLPMDPAAISVLEREEGTPLLRLWNFHGQVPG